MEKATETTGNKLPAEFKTKWLAALRSGEYKQGRAQLHNRAQNTFCCLGVACKIVAPDKEIPNASHILHHYEDFKDVPTILKGYHNNSSSSDHPVYKLISMNDRGKSFEDIANWIEKNL